MQNNLQANHDEDFYKEIEYNDGIEYNKESINITTLHSTSNEETIQDQTSNFTLI